MVESPGFHPGICGFDPRQRFETERKKKMRVIIGWCVVLIGTAGGILGAIAAAVSSPGRIVHPGCAGGWEAAGICDRVTTNVDGIHELLLWTGIVGAVVMLIAGFVIAYADIPR
jgi:hypothetical protein